MFATLTEDLMDLRSYETGTTKTLAATAAAKCCCSCKMSCSTCKVCCCTSCANPFN